MNVSGNHYCPIVEGQAPSQCVWFIASPPRRLLLSTTPVEYLERSFRLSISLLPHMPRRIGPVHLALLVQRGSTQSSRSRLAPLLPVLNRSNGHSQSSLRVASFIGPVAALFRAVNGRSSRRLRSERLVTEAAGHSPSRFEKNEPRDGI